MKSQGAKFPCARGLSKWQFSARRVSIPRRNRPQPGFPLDCRAPHGCPTAQEMGPENQSEILQTRLIFVVEPRPVVPTSHDGSFTPQG